MLARLLAIALFFAFTWSAAHAQTTAAAPPLQRLRLTQDGQERAVAIYEPAAFVRDRPAPLIVALHGRFSSPQALHAMSRLAAVADLRGAIVIYPESVNGFWNDGGHVLLNRPGPAIDDLSFVTSAIEAAKSRYAIDPAQIYVVGYDAGGSLATAFACRTREQLAGVAVVASLMWDFVRDGCGAARPTPVLIIHGRRDDPYAPINGGDVGQGIENRRLGVADTLAVWRRVNGCDGSGVSGRGSSVFYSACSSGAALAYVGVDGGGHNWFRRGAGYRVNRPDVDATALVDAFFFDRAHFALPQARPSGRSRSWIVYAPPGYDPGVPTPVVVLLHGLGGNAGGMAQLTGMNAVADRHNFLVVYPDGIDNMWNAQFDVSARAISLSGRRSMLPQDDVGFLQTMMDDVAVDFNIDRSRLYLGGFSNGGFMSYRMACSAGATFAAFAPVSGNLYLELADICRRSPPTPILIMHGTADPSVPYEGVLVQSSQSSEPVRISYGIQETVALFARRNHCSLAGTNTTFATRGASPGTEVMRFALHDCPAGEDVVLYRINGGGHSWPGHPRPRPEMGDTNMDMDAGEVIWSFFVAHTLQQPARR